MRKLYSGLTSWLRTSNHNSMMLKQQAGIGQPEGFGTVTVSYFGSSAFRLTTPQGLTVMVDPWRNHPSRTWDWYFKDMPLTSVDIGVSTHAHFDHDALDRLDANVLLDRPIGRYSFLDLSIEGIADKHATDASAALYDFKLIHKRFNGVNIEPPDNPRSWDNVLVVIETGGLRFLHWGDNRHNPPDYIWEMIGDIDIVLLPVDDSQHVMGFEMIDRIIDQLKPKVVIPHHYYVMEVTQRQSTLLPATKWLQTQSRVVHLSSADAQFSKLTLPDETTIHHFGEHVAFDAEEWRSRPEED
jgi:L-ascorbate metabolism protein UlaG (beta-lactamase superfamily)